MDVAADRHPVLGHRLFFLIATPAVVVFISSNIVNVGNLAFNMIFSRLMGPELFGVLALVLTIKLALLGLIGAVQTATSHMIAGTVGDENTRTEQALSRINRLILTGLFSLGFLLTAGVLLAETVGARSGLPHLELYLILLAALPFGASFCVLRGVAYGRMASGRIALSANVEMGVRLAGGLLAWFSGLGLPGVVAAVSLSIISGWAVLAGMLPRRSDHGATGSGSIGRSLFVASLPFALLQLGQTLALDGDIFLAQALLPADEAGQIAALSLFQRIQFFACFALASVLLPSVVIAAREGTNLISATRPVMALFVTVSACLLVAASVAPGLIVTLLVGGSFAAMATALLPAVAAAVAFTFSYLAATFLSALGHRSGIAIVFAAALVQLAAMGTLGVTRGDLVHIELVCQLATALLMIVIIAREMRRRSS